LEARDGTERGDRRVYREIQAGAQGAGAFPGGRIQADTGRQGPSEPDTEPTEEPRPEEFLPDDAICLRRGGL